MKTKLCCARLGQLAAIVFGFAFFSATAVAQSATGITVALTSPTDGSIVAAPAQLTAVVSGDTNGTVAYVSFVSDEVVVGSVTNAIIVDPPAPPGSKAYMFTWANPSDGLHYLHAEAVETNGDAISSSVIFFTVKRPGPMVRITSPPNYATFRAPVDIPLIAYAGFFLSPLLSPNSVTNVEFYAGTNDLGAGTRLRILPVATPLLPIATPGSNYFRLIWSNAPPGTYNITAVASDAGGIATTSPPIALTVLPAIVPPTNFPPIVTIVASDPIAIATTNCWEWLGLGGGPPVWSNWVSPTALWVWFTNCGPKDATFTVARYGPTNADLTVNYAIGGSASNGVNYMTLPGTVTIGAGESTAMISIVPIDTGATNAIQSVVLTLDPSTNSPVTYAPGPLRHSAAALILDGPAPIFPLASVLGGNPFHLSLPGPDGAWFRLDYTVDALNWNPICTNQVVNGTIDFLDPGATNSGGFYRVVPLPNGPPD